MGTANVEAGTSWTSTARDAAASRPGIESAVLLSVIVPVYNEAASIEKVISAVDAVPLPKEIVVVDDGSTDGTSEKVRGCRPLAELHVLRHPVNRGKAAAIRSALNLVRGEFVIIQDADLEYFPSDYPALLQPLLEGQTNAVYGVRNDHPSRGRTLYLGARFLTLLTNLLYRCDIHDEATGYKVFRRNLLQRIILEREGFDFCPEVTAKIARLGERIHEVPISYHPRLEHQGKKLHWTDGISATWTLIRYRFAPRNSFERIARD